MASGFQDDAVLIANAAWRIIDGQALLASYSEGKLHLLNEVGTRIWELIQDERAVGEIVDGICEEFEVRRDDARKDVQTFIAELVRQKICSVGQPER